MRALAKAIIAAASLCLAASAAHGGDQGDPARACDGNTYEMVECLKARTAQRDKRMTVAYQQALKECMRSMTEARARELEGLGHQ
jgi:uncharacterized protein YecT (DUF1311 family)